MLTDNTDCCTDFFPGAMDVVKLLLKHGADPQATCNEGKTPFDQARTSPEISLLLHKANTSADSSAAKRMASCANCGMLNLFIIWCILLHLEFLNFQELKKWKHERLVHTIPGLSCAFNPFSPGNDQNLNSPYNFNTLSSRQVLRIKKIIN